MVVAIDDYVDCSSNNGIPDVAAYAAAGHRKLSIKVSEGTGYHWYDGDDVAQSCLDHGLRREFYHWLRPDSDARLQADFYVGWVEKHWQPGDDAMTDYERTFGVIDPPDAQRADQLATYNERVTALLARPRVYTGGWYLAAMGVHSQAECRRWDVVMSDYDPILVLPNPFSLRIVAWQYTQTARVAGFAGLVDYNRTLVADEPPAPANLEAGQMFEIMRDQHSGKWYMWAAGYWRWVRGELHLRTAAASPLCVNGAAVRDYLAKGAKSKLLGAVQFPHVVITERHTLALGSEK